MLRQGLRREHVVAVVAICAAADAALMAAGIAGLGAILTDAPAVVTAARWGGAAFLLGYAILAARRALQPAALTPLDRPPATLRATLLACPAFTFLNPHVYLDTVVLLGTVAHHDRTGGRSEPGRPPRACCGSPHSTDWHRPMGARVRAMRHHSAGRVGDQT